MNLSDEQQDELLDDATHAVGKEFARFGINLSTEDLYQINDFLTQFLAERVS